MNMLSETIKKIKDLDIDSKEKANERLNNLIMPKRALGKIMDLAEDIAGIYKTNHPKITNCSTVIFAADHGIAQEKISLYPQEVTTQLVKSYINELAGVNAMSMAVDAPVYVVDVGVNSNISHLSRSKIDTLIPKVFYDKKISMGTLSFIQGPAMSRKQAIKSIEIGIEMADLLTNKYDLIAAGEMGIGNTTSSAIIVSILGRVSPREATGRGTGLNDKDLERKILNIEKAIEVNQPDKDDAIDILAKVGGYEIGAMCGFYLGCAANNQPVVLDGFNSSAAALIACKLAPKVNEYMIASHLSKEKAHILALNILGKKPYFDYNLRLGEATGAVFMFPLLKAAANLLNKMATFEEAAVAVNQLDSYFINKD